MMLYDTLALDGVRRTADGYLAAFARIARTGIQEYKGSEVGRPDMKTVRIYRPPNEVFAPDALKSFAHRPVTLTHPTTPVTAKNWKRYAGGQTGAEVVRDGEFVRVPMVMMDQRLIDAYEKRGVKELSMGYSTELLWDAGTTPDGQAYDAVQTEIRGNHLAVVPVARGGDQLRIGDRGRKRRKPLAFDTETSFRALLDKINEQYDPDDEDEFNEDDDLRMSDMGDDDENEDEDEDESPYTGDASMMYDTEFSAGQRKKLAESGAAMPDGGFPIRNAEDLHHAMEAIGRAKDPSAARAHIKSRAKALGLESELSQSFKDAWSDESRAAALEARRNATNHFTSAREHREKANRFKLDGNVESSKYHAKAAKSHMNAGQHFQAAEASYHAGKKDEGDRHSSLAYKSLSKINDAKTNLISCPQCGEDIPPGATRCPQCNESLTKDGVVTMKQIIVDGLPVDVVSDQGAAIVDRHITKLEKDLRDAKVSITTFDGEKVTLQKVADDAKKLVETRDGEIVVLKKQVADAAITPEKLDVMVKDRLDVIDRATLILDKAYVFDGKTIGDIRKATVEKHLGDAAKGMSDGAIEGAFVAATTDAAKRATGGSQPIRDAVIRNGGRQVSVTDAREDAWNAGTKAQGEAWRRKPGAAA